MPGETDRLLDRLAALPAAPVSDVLRVKGQQHQVLHHSIAAYTQKGVTGLALTVAGEMRLGGGKGAAPDMGPRYEMFRHVGERSVLVIATGGYTAAVALGANVVVAARVRGCRGIVTDGGVRDAGEIRQSGLPVFATFRSPLSGGGHWRITRLKEPVALPGQSHGHVLVRTGDVVHGDADGVVVFPAGLLAEVVPETEELCRIEGVINRALATGEDPEQVYARADRFTHIRRPG